jgi:putative membrane protein
VEQVLEVQLDRTADDGARSQATDDWAGRRRTDLAEDRTILASERTFAGWSRTSLGCIAIGIGFHALFNRMQPDWVPRTIASWFLLLAALIVWLAARRLRPSCANSRRMWSSARGG